MLCQVNEITLRCHLHLPLIPTAGTYNAPDFSGATAAEVSTQLKSRGNPAYSEAIDPSLIGATLEVSVPSHDLTEKLCVLTFETGLRDILVQVCQR